MQVTARSYLTSGMAVLGAGAIALSPIQPLPNHTSPAQERAVSNLAVNLAASIDPITPWVETFQTAVANIQALAAFYAEKPFPLLQTVGANIGTYFDELANGNAGQIPGQIQNNIQTFFLAPWDPGRVSAGPPPITALPAGYPLGDFISRVPLTNRVPIVFPNGASQQQLYTALPGALPAEDFATLFPLLKFIATPYSGQLAGLIGPVLSPLVQVTRSFTEVGTLFQAGDVIGAINELINIPANVTNAFLNGAGYLDLTNVVNSIQPLPSTVRSIGLNLGGLISSPVPFTGTLAEPTAFSGGTLMDSLAASASLGVTVTSPALPSSWYGSVIGLGQLLGEQLLVTPTPPPPVAAAATEAAPAVDAAPEETAPSEPATEEAPVAEETAPSASGDSSGPVAEAPAAEAPEAPARAHRGGGRGTSDDGGNGGNSGGRGHRGAA